MQPAASIFKAYDIRGVVDETLTDEVVTLIGAALGLLIQRAGKSECVVGRDGRLSGPRLVDALADLGREDADEGSQRIELKDQSIHLSRAIHLNQQKPKPRHAPN